ncbi:MAG: leucine-rich repeat domain-containing protein [Prevotellaceae bacterium]|nr:leucine-rich repeat domain-containing protein [Prevotellaceae bacterium]
MKGHAFQNCSSLVPVNIPQSVKTFEDDVFSGCTRFAPAVLDLSTVEKMENGVFAHTGVKSVITGEKLTALPNSTFEGCTKLQSIEIGSNIAEVKDLCFMGCIALESIDISSATTVGGAVFTSCHNLKSVILSDALTELSTDLFGGCSSLTNITIPAVVTTIGINAFANCSSLTEITIPAAVTTIDENAFAGCRLARVINLNPTPQIINENVFSDRENIALKVPDETAVADYRATDVWKEFKSIEIYY